MRFEWDEQKNVSNQRKHRVSFETATLVFDDPLHRTIQDREIDGEERWQAIGFAEGALLLVVAHTFREENGGETVRIISARKADSHERKEHESDL